MIQSDPEFEAMAVCWTALSNLPPEAFQRVFTWLRDRLASHFADQIKVAEAQLEMKQRELAEKLAEAGRSP